MYPNLYTRIYLLIPWQPHNDNVYSSISLFYSHQGLLPEGRRLHDRSMNVYQCVTHEWNGRTR